MIRYNAEILECITNKLQNKPYYLSWWLRLDLNDKYTTPKINYELNKCVKLGLLESKSHRYGIEYSLPNKPKTS
jgi:hypothetical protein